MAQGLQVVVEGRFGGDRVVGIGRCSRRVPERGAVTGVRSA